MFYPYKFTHTHHKLLNIGEAEVGFCKHIGRVNIYPPKILGAGPPPVPMPMCMPLSIFLHEFRFGKCSFRTFFLVEFILQYMSRGIYSNRKKGTRY